MNTAILSTVAAPTVLLGSVLAYVRTPRAGTISLIQHFTADLVLAAVATKRVPGLMGESYLLAPTTGLVCGVGVMLSVKQWANRLGNGPDQGGTVPAGLVSATRDRHVHRRVAGGRKLRGGLDGFIVTIALTIEVFFPSMSVSSILVGNAVDRRKAAATTSFFGGFLILFLLEGTIRE